MSASLVEDAVRLLLQHMNLVCGMRKVGVPRGSPLDQQAGSLTDQLHLPVGRWKNFSSGGSRFVFGYLSSHSPCFP
jgi:hypothetical protein